MERGYLTLSWHGFSQGNICLRPLPSALSTSRMERTSSVSSEGSSEAEWSLPFHVLSKVTWRSMTFVPRATAATEILIPDSWPEYPMGISGNSFWYSCSWQVGQISLTLKGPVYRPGYSLALSDVRKSQWWDDDIFYSRAHSLKYYCILKCSFEVLVFPFSALAYSYSIKFWMQISYFTLHLSTTLVQATCLSKSRAFPNSFIWK